ncbi:MAG: hypothetical protein IJY51_05470 [Treponema sp.]|uniref:hypothetical protein n=1 Tax=Treponema sp. TaxID=166 RepID=UPI00257A5A60|nr:hypothetical protein [Treponema sp.]MBQ9102511.1 hypothetical protein [Treponema sp.]
MNFEEWIEKSFPNKGNNEHTTYSIKDMKDAFFAKETAEEKTQTESQSETQDEKSGPSGNSDQLKNKTYKAKTTSLIAQIIAALWVALWSAKNFIVSGGEINDIIFSGFAIAACFSPVYFNMILDKIKTIKFGE